MKRRIFRKKATTNTAFRKQPKRSLNKGPQVGQEVAIYGMKFQEIGTIDAITPKGFVLKVSNVEGTIFITVTRRQFRVLPSIPKRKKVRSARLISTLRKKEQELNTLKNQKRPSTTRISNLEADIRRLKTLLGMLERD